MNAQEKTSRMLDIRGLHLAYNGRPVLKGVNWQVPEGSYTALIGPNGSGKSTLLKCINRIVKPAMADIRIMGRPLADFSQKELARHVAYVAQTPAIIFNYSVEEFVGMGRYPYLSACRPLGRRDRELVHAMMEYFDIAPLAHRSVHQLSGGERQKVLLAAALVQQPRLLLLDEPTSQLDPHYHIMIQEHIRSIAQEQKITVIHVTHDLSHLCHWCDHVTAIKDGQIQWGGRLKDELTRERLEELFGTPFVFSSEPGTDNIIIYPEVPHDSNAHTRQA